MRLFVTALAVASIACSRPAPPVVEPQRIRVTAVDRDALHFELDLAITNPNSGALRLRDLDARVVFGDGADAGELAGGPRITVPESVVLLAGQSTSLTVPVSVAWTDMRALAALAGNAAAVPYSVDGSLEVGGLFHFPVPFHFGGTLTRAQIATAALRSIPGLAP